MKIASILSGKKRRVSRTTIMAEGITVDRFSQILDSLMVESTTENRNVNLSVYPEHYVLTPDEYGVLEVIEKRGMHQYQYNSLLHLVMKMDLQNLKTFNLRISQQEWQN